jgi:hypothetical protein
MQKNQKIGGALFGLLLTLAALGNCQTGAATNSPPKATLWTDPGDIGSRDLEYGAGGEKAQPHPPFTFVKEDAKGSNPKFEVQDAEGEKWKVKLGVEARPETAATRLLWAVGYFTDQDYFLPELKVENLPTLKRGQEFVKPGGIIVGARLKRHPKHTEKNGVWHWGNNPFTGTRELNGLRVMMSLVNNWDLKDENNAVYLDKETGNHLYLVDDVGASFGTMGYRLGSGRGKGDLGAYKHSKFISHIHKDSVDFGTPAHSTIIGTLGIFSIPNFVTRLNLRWIGRQIPRQDAKWVGSLLAQLKPEQIQDAFRAAGYNDKQVKEYAKVIEKRIAALEKL